MVTILAPFNFSMDVLHESAGLPFNSIRHAPHAPWPEQPSFADTMSISSLSQVKRESSLLPLKETGALFNVNFITGTSVGFRSWLLA